MTFGAGVQPSSMTINSPPHLPSLDQYGTLRITYDSRTVTFKDCAVVSPHLTADLGGHEWSITILDRRWKWQFGVIFGSYNVRQPDESFLREKTPQELATILLEAMGETNFDVSALPNEARPSVEWAGDTPAAELDSLCGSLGCIVAIDSDGSNKTRICRIGEGGSLPAGYYLGGGFGIEAKPTPETILVLGERTLYQARFATESVGLETDNITWKPIDQLSYKPVNGWEKCYPPDFGNVTGTYIDAGGVERQRADLAKRTVHRHYRITRLLEGGWVPKALIGTDYAPSGFDDLELLDERVENIVGPDGVKRSKPTAFYANYWDQDKGSITTMPPLARGASLDVKTGIVSTHDPLFKWDAASGAHKPAEVVVECAFHAGRFGVFSVEGYELNTGSGTDTGPLVVKRTDIQRKVIQSYDAGNVAAIKSDTEAQTHEELQYYAEEIAKQYTPVTTSTRTYEEIRDDIEIDGNIVQITWSGGAMDSGKTTVSTGRGHNVFVPSIEEMRRKQKLEKVDVEKRPPRK